MRATRLGIVSGMAGQAELFQCDPPVDGHDFVVCSAVNHVFATEIFAFPANVAGEITDFGELSISRRGLGVPEDILIEAGYEIVEKDK